MLDHFKFAYLILIVRITMKKLKAKLQLLI